MIIRRNMNGTHGPVPRRGVGDLVEAAVKPAAVALQRLGLLNCLDEQRRLKADSPCAKRRDALNRKFGKP